MDRPIEWLDCRAPGSQSFHRKPYYLQLSREGPDPRSSESTISCYGNSVAQTNEMAHWYEFLSSRATESDSGSGP